MQKFIGGIGCFWDETKYEGIPGVISTECGYCGGKSSTVSYEQVCGGDTEHIEVVKVEFDPKIISYEEVLLDYFLNFMIQLHQIVKDQMSDISTVQKYFIIPMKKKRLLKKF